MLLEKVMFNQKFVDRANKDFAEAVEKGEFARAVETLQRLLKLFPDKAALHFNMAVAQGGLLNEEKAMDEIDTAIRLEPGPKYQDKKREIQRDLSRELGQKALNDQDFPRATSLYHKLTEIDPQNARAFYGLALSLDISESIKRLSLPLTRRLGWSQMSGSTKKSKKCSKPTPSPGNHH
ncbi:MAG TPA: tetratricopeptide repeat protein [Nitrososphaera sp.]|nr:tetratricopeptide repeat protein [Nitrososphaera sp.]